MAWPGCDWRTLVTLHVLSLSVTEETRAGLATADARARQQGLEALTREPFGSCGRGGPPEPDLYRVV